MFVIFTHNTWRGNGDYGRVEMARVCGNRLPRKHIILGSKYVHTCLEMNMSGLAG